MSEMSAPTTPTTPGAEPRRLVRTPDGKIAGVAAGIAHYLGLDPAIVRIAFLALAFAGGAGIVLYGACWIAMPKGPTPASDPAPRQVVDPWLLGAIAALVLGIGLLFGWNDVGPGFQATVGLALVGVGVWLLVRRHDEPGGPGRTVAPPPPEPPDLPVDEGPASPGDVEPTAPPPAAPAAGVSASWDSPIEAVAAPPRRTGVTAATLSAALLAAGLALVAGLTGWVDVTVSGVLALTLVVVGAGLVVAAFVGRAGWLFVVGVLLTGALLTSATVEAIADDGVGDRTVAPQRASQMPDRYARGVGQLTVDLTDLAPYTGARRLEVHVGIGRLVLELPQDVRAIVDAHVGAGTIQLPLGRETDGLSSDAVYDTGGSGGVLRIDANVGIGDLEVHHA